VTRTFLSRDSSSVSATCFYHLRQLRRIRRSFDADSAATLVHAFVTSRVDYCNAIIAAAPKTTTDRLQRVLNAAARVVSDTKKFDQGLSRLMHQELHWLDIHERVNYKLGVLTHGPPVSARQGASVGLAVKLLHSSQSSSIAVASTLRCTSSTDRTSTSSQHLRSAGICCRWSDNVNTLPDDLRDPAVSTSTFRQSLKTRLFSAYQHV